MDTCVTRVTCVSTKWFGPNIFTIGSSGVWRDSVVWRDLKFVTNHCFRKTIRWASSVYGFYYEFGFLENVKPYNEFIGEIFSITFFRVSVVPATKHAIGFKIKLLINYTVRLVVLFFLLSIVTIIICARYDVSRFRVHYAHKIFNDYRGCLNKCVFSFSFLSNPSAFKPPNITVVLTTDAR